MIDIIIQISKKGSIDDKINPSFARTFSPISWTSYPCFLFAEAKVKKLRSSRNRYYVPGQREVHINNFKRSVLVILPSCNEPHYESEANCEVFIMKISFH